MRKEEESIKYRVVVKTNALAASFYEELCAFVTGQVSEIDSSNSKLEKSKLQSKKQEEVIENLIKDLKSSKQQLEELNKILMADKIQG